MGLGAAGGGAASGGARTFGLGVFFLPAFPLPFAAARSLVERAAEAEGFELLAWREVPTLPQVLGEKAGKSLPRICQAAFMKKGADGACLSGEALERSLYILRKGDGSRGDGKRAWTPMISTLPSLSSRTIV